MCAAYRSVPVADKQPFMISPLPTPRQTADEHTSHHSTYGAFSLESAAVDGSADKCGSTSGACPAHMAPADITQRGSTADAITTTSSAVVVAAQQQVRHPSSQPAGASNGLPGLQPQQPELASKPQRQQPQQPATMAAVAAAAPQPADLNTPEQQLQQATDSEDDSWTPGQQQSSGDAHADNEFEEEETWDPHGPPPQYCTNCTARLCSSECSDCGHSSEQDEALFDSSSSGSGQPIATSPAAGQPLIVWDDEMLLHEEGKAVPHPERPDRLRAIMARLVGNGLTGVYVHSSSTNSSGNNCAG